MRRKLHIYRWNLFTSLRVLVNLKILKRRIADLYPYERHISSQHGEDGVLEAIFARIGTTNKYFVEFGAGHGGECNTAQLSRKKGWTGLLMDGAQWPENGGVKIHREFITAENINQLFEKYKVPPAFDLLSIDIDGNDYWIWSKLSAYRPRVVVIEYNGNVPPDESRVIEYDRDFRWSGSDYYGASLLALKKLGKAKGYTLIGCESSGTNAFFVEDSLAERYFVKQDITRLFRPPIYGKHRYGHQPDASRTMKLI